MGACCGEPIPSCNAVFDDRTAADDLAALRSKGPPWATRELLAQLAADLDLEGLSVLDIGAGVGAVHLGLLELGAATAVDVDGSSAYLAAARDEADRRELAERVTHVLGDATVVGDSLAAADLVAIEDGLGEGLARSILVPDLRILPLLASLLHPLQRAPKYETGRLALHHDLIAAFQRDLGSGVDRA